MSLGNGCVEGSVQVQKDSFIKRNYCNSDFGWRNCPHRPMNDGNKEVQKKFNYAKASDNNTRLGQCVIIIIIILVVISKFFL